MAGKKNKISLKNSGFPRGGKVKKIIPAIPGMRRLEELCDELCVSDLAQAGFRIISNPNFSMSHEKISGNLARI